MTTPPSTLPPTQHAVQLVGPSKLALNPAKPVGAPGPHEVVLKIEAVGLCFSDLKLLKQFDAHPRKTDIQAGLNADVLKEISGYVPNAKPTVPGHEVVARIIKVGDKVQHHKVGERVIVQADWRDLRTNGSNGAFGYNFEGGLQEFCILDERTLISSKGERYLIPVDADAAKGSSAVALVEPWACVEDSYVNRERQAPKAAGKTLIVAEAGAAIKNLAAAFSAGKPASITAIVADAAQRQAIDALDVPVTAAANPADLPNEGFDDILYFGASKATLDVLNDKLAKNAILNITLAGKKIGQLVSVGVGRIHYGGTRWVGTTTDNPADGYTMIPATGELRANDSINVVGAGGPMGQMHVIRNICSGLPGLTMVGTDMDDARLASLGKKADPLAKANKVPLRLVNTAKQKVTEKFSYWALMAPIGALVAEAVLGAAPNAIVNIFAGIPAPVKHDLDVDAIIANRVFVFGTSGSEIEDMKIVLRKVQSGQLDTNASVDAVSGMAGAIDGLDATEKRTLAGKIIVYPMLHELGLTPLTDLPAKFPTVAAKLHNGQWTKEAEAELLRVAK